MVSLKLFRSSTYGWLASGLGCPGVAGNPDTIDSVALPNAAFGVERVPPLLLGAPFAVADPGPVVAPVAEAFIIPAVPPLIGIVLLGLNAARLQVCSMGAKVKSSF